MPSFFLFASAASVAMLAATTSAAPASDEVKALPGWDAKLPSKQYSGFLKIGNDNLHYIFVESSGPAAEKAPVSCCSHHRP